MTSVSTDRRQGLNSSAAIKVPVRVATTAAIVLSGLQTIDGVALVAGERVLIKNQANAAENGIYNADTGNWTRALDLDGAYDVLEGTIVTVLSGNTYASTSWRVSTTSPSVGSAMAWIASPISPTDSNNVQFVPSGVGAVVTTVQADLRSLHLIPAARFGVVAGGTDMTTKLINAIKSGENISLPRGVIGYDGNATLALTDTGIVGGTANYGQKLIGAGPTNVTNYPTRGTVLKRLAGTGIALTIPTYAEGNEIAGICFDQNGFAGKAIKTGMHKGHIHDLVIHNQGGADYGILMTGVNFGKLSRVTFSGTCYGGVLLDNTAGTGYSALYSQLDRIVLGQATGGLTDYGLKMALAGMLTVDDFFVQGGAGVYMNNGNNNIILRNTRAEMDQAKRLIYVDGATGTSNTQIHCRGGRVTQITTSAGAVPFLDFVSDTASSTARGIYVDGWYFSDNISAANRPYIQLKGIIGGEISNLYMNNGTANKHYAVLCGTAAGNRSDFVTLRNFFNENTATANIQNSVYMSDGFIGDMNVPLTFGAGAASQRMIGRNILSPNTGTLSAVDAGNCSQFIYEGGFVTNGTNANQIGYTGAAGAAQTVDSDAMAANEISLITSTSRVGNVFLIIGTKNITSIDASSTIAGRIVVLKFAGILTFTDGNNLKLNGNFVTSADDTITLVCDGTNWYEMARSAN